MVDHPLPVPLEIAPAPSGGLGATLPLADGRSPVVLPDRPDQRETPMSSHVRSRSPFMPMLVVAFVAFAFVALGGAPAAWAQKKVLNIAAKEPETLDPHTSILGQSQAIYRFLYRGLTRFAIRDGKVTTAEVDPDLAESWTLSPDGTMWTFKLKKGVQFHKGFGEFTAEDVKYSFERDRKSVV